MLGIATAKEGTASLFTSLGTPHCVLALLCTRHKGTTDGADDSLGVLKVSHASHGVHRLAVTLKAATGNEPRSNEGQAAQTRCKYAEL